METIDGSANEGEDYIAVNEILTFEPYETEKEVIMGQHTVQHDGLLADRGDDRGRQPVGAGRGVLPQADDAARSWEWGGEAGSDQHHGDHHPQR